MIHQNDLLLKPHTLHGLPSEPEDTETPEFFKTLKGTKIPKGFLAKAPRKGILVVQFVKVLSTRMLKKWPH